MQIDHIDTCLPCYLLDHCNGDKEQLLCVAVDSTMRMYQTRDDLIREIECNGDKIPDGRDSEAIAAARALFASVHPLKVFDAGTGRADDDSGESCYACFRLSWEEESE